MEEHDVNSDSSESTDDDLNLEVNVRTIKNLNTGGSRRRCDKLSHYLGCIIFLVAVFYVSVQLARWSLFTQNICLTYLALAIIPLSLALYLRGVFPYWVHKRRTVNIGELNDLYSEVDSFVHSNVDSEILKLALEENKRLDASKNDIFEIDILPLRKRLVDLYEPEHELIAKAKRELNLLNEYTAIVDVEEGDKWNKFVTTIIKKLEDELEAKKKDPPDIGPSKIDELKKKLRSVLKSLRETVAWYDQTWAIGEKLKDCVTCWVAVISLVTLIVGILPMIHSNGDWDIGILHWAALGSTGALLSILLRLQNLDVPELGETAGYDLLQGAVRSIVIGALTAVILFAAIWGKALGGEIFPELQVKAEVVESSAQFKNHGLSIFWAIFAGLSPIVLKRLSQIAGSSLGEPKNDLDDK